MPINTNTFNPDEALNAFKHYTERHSLHYDIADLYGEPGYAGPDPDACIILSDWNDVPDNLQEYLQDNGHHLEWSDEWVTSNTYPVKAYRQQPDSYSWQPSFFITEGGDVVGADDVCDGSGNPYTPASAFDEYLSQLSIDRDNVDHYLACGCIPADRFGVKWGDVGFALLTGSPDSDDSDSEPSDGYFDSEPLEFETGFHPGHDDDPVKVLGRLAGQIYEGATVILQITDVGQFDCRWQVWVKADC